ncbi:PQQ-binding-like beta-propeller repeat protein [Streptomyces sp. NBC_00059]|uniref:protein kinase domain-containing protein n=1 Tax=Streptomyces sp. NBC_00059 TaxID=2975635 RepID=UPI00224FCF5E|nr:PQQ-binding-like beta-propeller repeat protein [Streptomyces sp. NBC_00059]MCX5410825.1 PQQ-binding-like beta-propeller repeat protein [Streptomyces sp. NBC_00059]
MSEEEPVQAFTPLETGDPVRVGPYRIVGRLGSGGMGRVYLARSPGGRATAVKVVHDELAEAPSFRARFRREVAAARRVKGPFTAPLVDADTDADVPWLATAHVPGLSLGAAVAAHGAWPERSVRALGSGLAEALGAIHRAEVVHRDLKPSNVLLVPDGPRVIDFGISVAADDTKLTTTGAVVGSPGYLPPEQLVGREVGPAGDVFALGALLVYTATGTGAFGGGPAYGITYRVVHEEPDLEGLPGGLADVVTRCLAKDPLRRPGVPELIEELGGWEGADGPRGTFTGATWLPAPVAADVTALRADPLPEEAATALAGTDLPTVAETPTAVATARLEVAPAGPSFLARRRGAARQRRLTVLAAAGTLVVLVVVAGLLLPRVFSGASGWDDGAESAGGPTAVAKQLVVRDLWSRETESVGRPVVASGKVVVEGQDGALRAVDGTSGDTVWTYDEPGGASLEGVTDGRVVASGRENGTIHAVDLDSGKQIWSVGAEAHTAPGTRWNLYLRVVLAAGTVYVNAMYDPPEDSELYGQYAVSALDAATGRLKWTRPVAYGVSDALAAVDGVVYCGIWEKDASYFYALDAETGDQLWRYHMSAQRGTEATAITVSGGTVYVGDSRGVLHAVDARRGTRLWTHEPDAGSVEWLEPLVVTEGVVLGGTGEPGGTSGPGDMHAIAADSGEPLWTESTEGEPRLHTLLDGSVLFSSETGTLHAADVRTGDSPAPTPLSSGDPDAAVAGDRVYFDGGDGRLHAGRISLTER